jgi:hypothetical protein
MNHSNLEKYFSKINDLEQWLQVSWRRLSPGVFQGPSPRVSDQAGVVIPENLHSSEIPKGGIAAGPRSHRITHLELPRSIKIASMPQWHRFHAIKFQIHRKVLCCRLVRLPGMLCCFTILVFKASPWNPALKTVQALVHTSAHTMLPAFCGGRV